MIWDINPTLIGPYALPWHGLFIAIELVVLAYLFRHWRKHGALTMNELFWLVLVGGAHAFYATKLSVQTPTFDLEIRYYGIFFAIGLLGAARAVPVYFERWGYPRHYGETLTLWMPVAMLVGAHFVHLLFYETESLIHDPIRIFQLGSGLASHGGGLGAALAVFVFARRNNLDPIRMMDAGMCGATWVIPWVRVGNFFNSEIVGREWNGPWAIWFPRHECHQYFQVPTGEAQRLCDHIVYRHPSQLYEATIAFIMLGLAIYLQRKWRNRLRPGAILFMLLGYYFTTRFCVEFFKESQGVDDGWSVTMGQLLSLPIVALSAYMLFFSKKSNILKPYDPATDPGLPALVTAANAEPPTVEKAKAVSSNDKRKKKRKKKS